MVHDNALSLHLLRLLGSLGTIAVGFESSVTLMVIGTAGTFFAAFAFAHDLMHGALGLPKPVRELTLAVLGALMLQSGHATRIAHHVHHRDLLSDDDWEGRTARLPWLLAALAAPLIVIIMRFHAYRRAPRRDRRWIVFETLVNLSTIGLAICFGEGSMLWVAATALGLHLSIPLWAGRLSHCAPDWVIRGARKLDFTGSTVLLSLAYHDLHHDHPKLATLDLPKLHRAIGR